MACDHNCPSFAKPIDTSHRVVCHGTLSAGKQTILSSNILSNLWLILKAK